jgi:gamma-glutamyltranspeptidase/glutathione hydrolase
MTRRLIAIACLALTAGTALAGSQVTAKKAALSTVSPAATQIGLSVLKGGGNAIDAAVAVAMALAVVHPQAGNLGGGGFLVYYEASTKAVWTLDFREVAPGASKRDMYVKSDGSISGDAQLGPMASAVPASVAGLAEMHRKFGTKKWRDLLLPAVRLARSGFKVDAELTASLVEAQRKRHIDKFPSTAALFYPSGKPLAIGAQLVQSDLADTLERLSDDGATEFYEGITARRIVEAMQAAGGIIGYRDLREYKPLWRAPIRINFREYEIYTVPPPSGGGLVLGETLSILAPYDLALTGFQTPASIHLMIEAERRAYLDRNKYLGDPASTRIPYRDLLGEERAKLWRASIDRAHASQSAKLTEPGTNTLDGSDHTTHFTIADEAGNIASITTTLNDEFGGGYVVPGCGFLLNNTMDDFAAAPGKPNMYGLVQSTANAIEPGKRAGSTMTPTIILKSGVPFLALGTRGGPTIPTSVLQVFLNVAIYKKSLWDAVSAPRYHHQGQPEEIFIEGGKTPQETLEGLNAMGHGLSDRGVIGDVHALMFDKGQIIAVADPRHGGSAGGY